MLSARAIDGEARGRAARRAANVRRERTGATGGVARIEGGRRCSAAMRRACGGRVGVRKVNEAACIGAAKSAGTGFIFAVVMIDGRMSVVDGSLQCFDFPVRSRCKHHAYVSAADALDG